MKIGVFIIASILITSVLISVGTLINVNDSEYTDYYSDSFRSLFGGVDKKVIIDPSSAYSEFENITIISSSSSEDGTYEEYKTANKVDSAQVSVWNQYKEVIKGFFGFSGLLTLQSLLIVLISAGLIIGSIEFIRRYKL